MKNFLTDIVKPLVKNTHNRVTLMRDLPEDFSGLFRIEEINVLDEWDQFYKRVSDYTLTPEPQVRLNNSDSYKLAFFLEFVANFYTYFGDAVHDQEYIGAVEYFFTEYKKTIGEKDQKSLFENAFKK